MINKKELQKLNPRERIKRLKDLEKQIKNDAIEIERLIKESTQELRIEKIAEENAPLQISVDITRLFIAEGEELERTVRNEAPESPDDYKVSIAYNDYSKLKKVMGYAVSGTLNEEMLETVDKIGERLQRFKYESASQEVADLVVASRAALHKIRRYAGLE